MIFKNILKFYSYYVNLFYLLNHKFFQKFYFFINININYITFIELIFKMNKKPLLPRNTKPTSSSPPTNSGNTL